MTQRKNMLTPAAPGAGSGSSGADGGGEGQSGGGAGASGEGVPPPSSSAAIGQKINVLPDPERDLACCRLPLTDLGNAERWRVRHGRDFRFCPEWGWLAWDGRRWKLLSEEKDSAPAALIASFIGTIRAIGNEAALVAASGCTPPVDFRSQTMRERFELDQLANERWGEERYLRGSGSEDDENERLSWLSRLDPLDFAIDVNKGKYFCTAIRAHAKSSEAGGMIGRMLKWIKGFDGPFGDIVAEPDDFDADRMAINVLNGTLRIVPNRVKRSEEEIAAGKSTWKTDGVKIKRFDHDRADMITKLAPVKFLPSAACPQYDAFIERVQPDAAMRRFVHQWGGYSLVGDISEHKLAFFHGGGRNGKGTWVEAVARIAGDYADSLAIESIVDMGGARRGDQATPDTAGLTGVRFLRISEPSKGVKLNDGLIKQVTGGDPMKVRHLNKGFFEFFPAFKITVSGNNKPRINDQSHGMWSRVQLVPWGVTIPDDEIDRTLPAKLEAEASGILNRLIAGLLDWRMNGLIVPEEVRMATRAYREDSDDVGRFLAAICEVSDDHDAVRVASSELHKLYRAWAEHAGGYGFTISQFKEQMIGHGFDWKQSDGVKWLGVRPRQGVSLEEVENGRWPEVEPSSSAAIGQKTTPDDGGENPPPPPVPGETELD